MVLEGFLEEASMEKQTQGERWALLIEDKSRPRGQRGLLTVQQRGWEFRLRTVTWLKHLRGPPRPC